MSVTKPVGNLNLKLTPEQIKQLKPLLDANGGLKAVYIGSSLEKDELKLSYVACNAGPGAVTNKVM